MRNTLRFHPNTDDYNVTGGFCLLHTLQPPRRLKLRNLQLDIEVFCVYAEVCCATK